MAQSGAACRAGRDLDLLSNGRFDFGIGKGYRWGEFHGFCIDMAEAEERYQETVAFLRKAWTNDGRFSHHGKYWDYDDVVIEPAPVQKPHPPLWVGAQSPNSIRYAAENGFNLLLGQAGSPEPVAEGIGVYRRAIEAQGRVFDPYTVGLHPRAPHRDERRRARGGARSAGEVHAQRPASVAVADRRIADDRPPAQLLRAEEMHKPTESDALIGRPRRSSRA